MKAKYTNFFICTLILFFFLEIFDHTNLLLDTFINSSKLWFYNLIPTLFPFFIITDLLSNYGFINFITKIFGNFMNLFKLPKETAYAFFMAIFSGFPGNSKLIKEILDNNKVSPLNASKLLTFAHFANPLFIIGTIGTIFLEDKKLSLLILLCHYITNILLGLIFKNIIIDTEKKASSKKQEQQSFINVLLKSINNAIKSLFIIYGIIVLTSLFINIITINFPIPSFYKSIITGLIEMTQGIKLISQEIISKKIKACIITFFLSFGGISIHLQVMSILSNYKINYYLYLLARTLHATIASLLLYFILSFF